MVLGRYLRMLVFEPRYSKWAIGVPGLPLLFAGVLVGRGEATLATFAVRRSSGGLPCPGLQHRQVRGGDAEPESLATSGCSRYPLAS